MAASQFDVMIELETTGKPISVSVYRRIDRLPRQGSRDVQDFNIKSQFPAEHSPDEIPEINRRVVVKVLNVEKRCLCNTPMMAGLRPKHIGEWNHDQSQFLCDHSAGFEPEEVQYYQRYRFGERLYTFLQGGSRRISHLLRSLAEDQWQLDIGSKALRRTWPCVPEVTLQSKLALLLLDSQ